MRAYLFPGQGAQYVGMGKDLYDKSSKAKTMFEKANKLLGFNITDLMFEGNEEDLRQTKVTQPSIFLHSVILAETMGKDFIADMVAGHSLGEFSALVAAKSISFDSGLKLVLARALAMQAACEKEPSTMAAIIGLEDKIVEDVMNSTSEIVVAANYNSPGQLVISGSIEGIKNVCQTLKEKGAKRALPLKVGGAFHSPFMEPAREELGEAIKQTEFHKPTCPIYQNVNAQPVSNQDVIKANLISQLTSPVRWKQTMQNMLADGAKTFIEVGPGNVLQGLVKRLKKDVEAYSA